MSFGLMTMLNALTGVGADNEEIIKAHLGKKIVRLEIKDEHLNFTFDDEAVLSLYDAGQSCCEYRHMSTDDDLPYYVGATLMDITLEDGPDLPDGEAHEQQFLHVKTSNGSFTVVNHNEHNGYYGGFSIVAVSNASAHD